MVVNLLLFAAGLVALVAGAEALVRGASRLALAFGVSPLVVGLTVVAFGTSAPEAAVAVGASLAGTSDLAVGNVVGSNIFNVLFILGVSALIVPLAVHSQLIRQEVPIMIGAALLVLVLVQDGDVSRIEGAALSALLVAYTVYLVVQSRAAGSDSAGNAAGDGIGGDTTAVASTTTLPWHRRLPAQFALVAIGLVGLVVGSRWLVSAAVSFAQTVGVGDVVIGLTVVAAGTSLPEVAASVAAALKGERDMAVGNVIGSSTFNLLGCIGLAAVAGGDGGLAVAPQVLDFDIWVMAAVSLASLPVFVSGREITRWEGAMLLGYYAAYMAWLVLNARDSGVLPAYSETMIGVVLPLTVVTLVVMLVRRGGVAR